MNYPALADIKKPQPMVRAFCLEAVLHRRVWNDAADEALVCGVSLVAVGQSFVRQLRPIGKWIGYGRLCCTVLDFLPERIKPLYHFCANGSFVL